MAVETPAQKAEREKKEKEEAEKRKREEEASKRKKTVDVLISSVMIFGICAAKAPIGTFLLIIILAIAVLSNNARIRWGAVIAVALFVLWGRNTPTPTTTAANYPEGFSRLTCTKQEPMDLSSSDSLPTKITLAAGCIHGPVQLPPHTWIQATLGGPGDWIAVQTQNGLSRIVYWTPDQDGNLGNILAGAQKIGIEGKGTLTLTKDFTK